ncbi:MAG: multicopper oxidase family protein, partial [Thermoanaerobaculia bacterium]
IPTSGNSVSTVFDIQLRENVQVPVYNGSGDCVLTPFTIRNYGWMPGNASAFKYGFPGPTLRVRKAVGTTPGGTITVDLHNNLPWPGEDQCNQGCEGPCNTTGAKPQCCSDTSSKMPDCFHGDNTTNLHFHGTHVSPQSPQDYVLLDLQPATAPDTDEHSSHGAMGDVVKGSFTYKVNPLGADQPEGTHWYHPHKHGSTALQVGNGMAGALIVEGPFDDWLNAQFPRPPAEKIMVVQQVHDLNFYTSAAIFAPYPLINGQLTPVVTMYPGEIQRWRVVAATMEASAQLTIDFPDGTGVKQIAQDGIQFAPQNYAKQPLVQYPATTYNLSPGNRADFLVQAPAAAGLYTITYDVFGRIEQQGDRLLQRSGPARGKPAPIQENVEAILEAAAPGAAKPGLLSIKVVPCPPTVACPAMSFPSTLPDLPPYLANITEVDDSHTVLFSLTGKPTVQQQVFAIGVDGQTPQQFNSTCANFTEPLGKREQWTISQNQNSSSATNPSPFHVFHIHTNPFQVLQNGKNTYDPPIWMDSITLPNVSDGSVVMRTQYNAFTGAYVLHCHFLGHEDRGMMLSVQTVCPNAQNTYGTPDPNGGPDDCSVPITPILQPCSTSTSSAGAARTSMGKH